MFNIVSRRCIDHVDHDSDDEQTGDHRDDMLDPKQKQTKTKKTPRNRQRQTKTNTNRHRQTEIDRDPQG